MAARRDADVVLDAARSAPTSAEYERVVLEHFQRCIGFDVGGFTRRATLGASLIGFCPSVLARVRALMSRFDRELAPVAAAALARGGVVADREALGSAALERTTYYQELVRPHGGQCTLFGVLTHRGVPVARLALGRTSGGFRDRDEARLRGALGALSVSEVALFGIPASPPRALTPREHEILDLLRLGFTNREIAAALGTSYRTVRNQLSVLFSKLEVSTRAEAVARSYESPRDRS